MYIYRDGRISLVFLQLTIYQSIRQPILIRQYTVLQHITDLQSVQDRDILDRAISQSLAIARTIPLESILQKIGYDIVQVTIDDINLEFVSELVEAVEEPVAIVIVPRLVVRLGLECVILEQIFRQVW